MSPRVDTVAAAVGGLLAVVAAACTKGDAACVVSGASSAARDCWQNCHARRARRIARRRRPATPRGGGCRFQNTRRARCRARGPRRSRKARPALGSKQGFSLVTLWFGYDANLEAAQFDVSQRVSQILYTLPPGIQQPFIIKFDITNIPVANVTVSSDGLDERQPFDLTYNVIEPQLERLPGVASATFREASSARSM